MNDVETDRALCIDSLILLGQKVGRMQQVTVLVWETENSDCGQLCKNHTFQIWAVNSCEGGHLRPRMDFEAERWLPYSFGARLKDAPPSDLNISSALR
jgi:hypothetical protein